MTRLNSTNDDNSVIVSNHALGAMLSRSKVQRTKQRHMALDTVPISEPARALVTDLAIDLAVAIGKRPLKPFKGALGAILGDLLAAAALDAEMPSYRALSAGAFTGQAVGFRPFTTVMNGLVGCGLVNKSPGVFKRNGTGIASQFWAGIALLDRVGAHGISIHNYPDHFASIGRVGFIPFAIVRRAERRSFAGEARGRNMPVDWKAPAVIAAKAQVDGINCYFAKVTIAGGTHRGFKRMFGAGNDPAFKWNMGGRLCSLGDSYQALKSADRAKMKLNEEAVVEIDIKGSHLTIVNALLGFCDHRHDPYEIDGIPRSVVKAWVTMTLGYGRFHQRWSNEAIRKYGKDNNGASLTADYPLLEIRSALIDHLPQVGRAIAEGIGWAKLQYIESCAIIDAVDELAHKHDIPALPVHDSLIVPVSALEKAKQVLSACFERHVGIKPTLEIKHGL
jgi:hypothetical protein